MCILLQHSGPRSYWGGRSPCMHPSVTAVLSEIVCSRSLRRRRMMSLLPLHCIFDEQAVQRAIGGAHWRICSHRSVAPSIRCPSALARTLVSMYARQTPRGQRIDMMSYQPADRHWYGTVWKKSVVSDAEGLCTGAASWYITCMAVQANRTGVQLERCWPHLATPTATACIAEGGAAARGRRPTSRKAPPCPSP